MKTGILCLGLLAACWAAQAQRNRGDDTEATERACTVTDCFFERDIRDFEIIDQTHVIVYTGSQRCAFHVEVRGTFCDLTFAPELYFSRANELPDGPLSSTDPFERTFGGGDTLPTPGNRSLKICSNDLGIQVHGGPFTETSSTTAPRDRFGNPRTDCHVSSVTSINDDQLVEFYVKRRVIPPLPPMGTGQIEVGEQEEVGEPQAEEEGAAEEQPARSSRRRAR
jgi:hypothetical protein